MIVRLPFPAPELFPNRRLGRHYAATKQVKDAQRDMAFWLTREVVTKGEGYTPPADGHIPLSLLFLTPDRRRRDADNMHAASKALLDGLARGLGIDDWRFKPVLVDWTDGPREGALIAAVGVTIVSTQQVVQ